MNTQIPNDPMMLLSFVNLKLRDFYPNLSDMCEQLEIDEQELVAKLGSIDYEYDCNLNRFV